MICNYIRYLGRSGDMWWVEGGYSGVFSDIFVFIDVGIGGVGGTRCGVYFFITSARVAQLRVTRLTNLIEGSLGEF